MLILQELAANVALVLDPRCALALEVRACYRKTRSDVKGTQKDLSVLTQLSHVEQQVCWVMNFFSARMSKGLFESL